MSLNERDGSLFIQIHFLTSYPASLLNRDDVGMAKRLPFGTADRIRISSQCLKRHWRMARGDWGLDRVGAELSVRSRVIFPNLVVKPLVAEGLNQKVVEKIAGEFQAVLLGKSEKSKKREAEATPEEATTAAGFGLETAQLIVLGRPEINFILGETRKIAKGCPNEKEAAKACEKYFKEKDAKQNLRALKNASGLDAALFGRMVTSDILARGDAAVHVAHAFTVHAEQAESDYFTAVDDLVRETGELGSAHINESELTSGLFYGYVVLDVPQLVMNLEGTERGAWRVADRGLASRVAQHLVHLITKVSPGAKLGSTAPYAYAQFLLAESGDRQPRTLANAFLSPVDIKAPGGPLPTALQALGEHLKAFDAMYSSRESRVMASMAKTSSIPAEDLSSVDKVADWVADRVRG